MTGSARIGAPLETRDAERTRAAAVLSIVSNACQVAIKVVLGLLTGSVAVLSEAAHSASDLLASGVAFVAVRVSARPADDDHHFGHHKAENLAAAIEGLLVLGAGALVAVESLRRLVAGGEPIVHVELAVAVMVASGAVNLVISRHLYRIARETHSAAIEGDAAHLDADVWTSFGTAAGLGVLALTGWEALDAIIGLAIAGYVLWLGLRLSRRAAEALLDRALDEDEMDAIADVLAEHAGAGVSFHAVRARRAGAARHIDLHMVVPAQMSVGEGHALAGRVKAALRAHVPNADVLVHLEGDDDVV